ncbi:uncharacterized protein CCDC7 [Ascaphus truei]|uniref:uncharacterized protein CCDC7 n=1 Tax=Ascaphus truei TaxID=8439 RepID=UPI003F599031
MATATFPDPRNRLPTERIKDLEDVYGQAYNEETQEHIPVGMSLSAFLSSCQFASLELDTTVHKQQQILESLYMWFESEVQHLEQLGEGNISADGQAPASHTTISADISKIIQSFRKLEKINTRFKDLPKTVQPTPSPAGAKMKLLGRGGEKPTLGLSSLLLSRLDDAVGRTDKIKRAQAQQGSKGAAEDPSPDALSMLQNFETHGKFQTTEAINRMIQELGEVFETQIVKLQKLEKEQEETESKYIKVKADFQLLSAEKFVLENELRKVISFKKKSEPKTAEKSGDDKKDVSKAEALLTSPQGAELNKSDIRVFLQIEKQIEKHESLEFQREIKSPPEFPKTEGEYQEEEKKGLSQSNDFTAGVKGKEPGDKASDVIEYKTIEFDELKYLDAELEDKAVEREVETGTTREEREEGEAEENMESATSQDETPLPLATLEEEITQSSNNIGDKVTTKSKKVKSVKNKERRASIYARPKSDIEGDSKISSTKQKSLKTSKEKIADETTKENIIHEEPKGHRELTVPKTGKTSRRHSVTWKNLKSKIHVEKPQLITEQFTKPQMEKEIPATTEWEMTPPVQGVTAESLKSEDSKFDMRQSITTNATKPLFPFTDGREASDEQQADGNMGKTQLFQITPEIKYEEQADDEHVHIDDLKTPSHILIGGEGNLSTGSDYSLLSTHKKERSFFDLHKDEQIISQMLSDIQETTDIGETDLKHDSLFPKTSTQEELMPLLHSDTQHVPLSTSPAISQTGPMMSSDRMQETIPSVVSSMVDYKSPSVSSLRVIEGQHISMEVTEDHQRLPLHVPLTPTPSATSADIQPKDYATQQVLQGQTDQTFLPVHLQGRPQWVT